MDSELGNSDAASVDDNHQSSVKLMTTPSMEDDDDQQQQQLHQQQQQQSKPKQTMKLKKCSFEDCKETMLRGKSGPWMCKYHRNKTYKETYKKKKSKHNPHGTHNKKMGDRTSPTMFTNREQQEHNQRVSMMGHVLNEKKLALMKSPMVQSFLQEQQNSLCNTRQRTLGLPRPSQMM